MLCSIICGVIVVTNMNPLILAGWVEEEREGFGTLGYKQPKVHSHKPPEMEPH